MADAYGEGEGKSWYDRLGEKGLTHMLETVARREQAEAERQAGAERTREAQRVESVDLEKRRELALRDSDRGQLVKEFRDKHFMEALGTGLGRAEAAKVAEDKAQWLRDVFATRDAGAAPAAPALIPVGDVGQTPEQAMAQAQEDKLGGLESLYGARLSQLRGLGGQLEEQYGLERSSTIAEQAILAKQTGEESVVRENYRENERGRIETEQTSRRLRAEAKETAQREIDDAVSEVVNFKIDPKRFYKNTWTALGAAIAAGLGEFGSKLAGGPNTALAIINRAVDQDIDAQKTELQNLKYGATAAGNAYKRLLDRHGDAEKAERLARAQALTMVEMKLGEIADRHKVPLQASRIGRLISGIEKQRIANALALSDKEFQSRIEVAKLRPAKVGDDLDAKDKEFFADMSEFYEGIKELKGSYSEIGGEAGKEIKRALASGETAQAIARRFPSGFVPNFMLKTKAFDERSKLLSKSLSKMKEGGKISDMDLIFYMERMPLADDNDYMIEYKLGVLEALAVKALQMRSTLTQGGFDKWQKGLQTKMAAGGVTSAPNAESLKLRKQLGLEGK